ncbi:MAG TPA: PQ-loop domain-containing transporter [Candidatus Thermoplasmatota archaeon]|nr:PQ-loop domain-containing transporter [Candidatus Thermoplasmatota archaeon]
MNVWDWLNLLGSIGFVACLTPQLMRTIRLRRADDLSLAFLVLVLFSSVCVLFYSAHRLNYVFAAAQVANLAVWGTVLVFKVRPAPKPAPA